MLSEDWGECRVAGNLWGADVDQLRTLARQFSKTADLLLQQSTQLSGQINNTPAWKGQDAEHFRSDWNGNHRALLQKTASRLKQESKLLLANADEQDRASTARGAGGSDGPMTGVSATSPTSAVTGWGADWMSDGNSPFRTSWDAYNGVLGLKTVPWGLRDVSHFAALHGDEVAENWRLALNSGLWREAAAADNIRGAFSGTANLLSGKFGDFAEMARGADAAPLSSATMLGLNSAGHLLGGAGVALDGLDTINAIGNGETGDAVRSGLKTALGALSFAPPPVGVTCMVIGGAWAAVELIPGAKDAIDSGFDAFGDFADDAAEEISDGVKDFFGF
jgi:hypothetical protein